MASYSGDGIRVVKDDRAGRVLRALLVTAAAVAVSMYEETKEQLYAPPALLLRKVEAGDLGRKTGRGFFTYN